MTDSIQSLKNEFGSRLLITAHHYQRSEIVALADIIGDSYKMAVEAGRSRAEYIVVCGVRFMAESAAILAKEKQKILLPDISAGCPMADMIDLDTAEEILKTVRDLTGKPVVPVTYMNSWADLKALTGEEGGSICTSGNARKIIAHYLAEGKPVLFMPDFNLGMNTANELGLKGDEIRTIRKNGTLTDKGNPTEAKIFLFDGYCRVHKVFTPADIAAAREAIPGVRVLVHPECTPETVSLADAAGSTEAMFREIRDAPDGAIFAIGTEARFIDRMIDKYPTKKITHLRMSFCQNMNRIDLNNLLTTLKAIKRHEQSGEKLEYITVSPEERLYAASALNAMVRITEAP